MPTPNTNATTLETYQKAPDAYLASTDQPISMRLKQWIDSVLLPMPTSARIIEIGSASGRDAEYMEARGYSVERTDAAPAFVEHLQKQGHSATQLNILTQHLPKNSYDLIYANAVFLHFERADLAHLLKRLRLALTPNGQLAFTLKEGRGDEWSNEKMGAPRYFCYWQQADIQKALQNAGFTNIDIIPRQGHQSWLCVCAARAMRAPLPPRKKKKGLAS